MEKTVKAVFDSNVLIDYLLGEKRAKQEFELYDQIHISMITWIEVVVGAQDETEAQQLKSFFQEFIIHPVSAEIAERSVIIRQKKKIRLPDAIIKATAEEAGLILVTRNTKDFNRKDPSVRIPY